MVELHKNPKLKEYVLDAISCITYTEATKTEKDITDTLTTKGKLQFFAKKMKEEFCHEYNINKHNGVMPRIIDDYIRGLPSSISIADYDGEIEDTAKKLEIDISSLEKNDDLTGNWYSTIGRTINELFKEHGIDVLRDKIGEPEKTPAPANALVEFLKENPTETQTQLLK